MRNDFIKASYCYYANKEIRKFASENRDNFVILNNHATFWNTTLHGLQTASFMALSRLFDEGHNTHSMHHFLGLTVAHPEFFSRAALERRRMKDAPSGIRPDWLDDYIANIWVPTCGDLRCLARKFRPYRRKWNKNYKNIRDQVFAHTVIIDHGEIAALFSNTLLSEIEEILQALHDMLEIVQEIWMNGRDPKQYKPSRAYIDDIVRETREFLRRLQPGS